MTVAIRTGAVSGVALALLASLPAASFGQATPAAIAGNVLAGDDIPWTQAADYQSKTFTLPTGTVRVVEFKKSGSAGYTLTTETELYVVKGSAEATVAGAETKLAAGDAVNLPTGVLHPESGQPGDTTIVLYTVPNASKTPAAGVVQAKDAKEIAIPATPEKDGVAGAGLTVRSYAFDGNSIRVAALKKPGKTPSNAHGTDSILYLLSGKMQITIGGESKVVKAGDALREPAGVATSWDVLEDSSFVSTSAPNAAK